MKKITFILPAFNEEENVDKLYDSIVGEFNTIDYIYEILLVNDGSTDGTLEKIKEIAIHDKQVKYVSFSRNFGKEAAIYAGLQNSTGDAVILMDSDLQHPASLVKEMIKGYEQGYHQVVACRNRKGESKLHRFLTGVFYRSVNKLSEVQLENGAGDFRLLSRKAVDSLLQLSENNRFSKGLYEWIGLSKKTFSYENVERQYGESKWSFSDLFSYALDGVLSFNTKPLRLCLYMGVFILFCGLMYIATTFVGILTEGIKVPGYFTTISAVLLLGGVQLLSLGIIGEYIGRIYNEAKHRPHYIVEESNMVSTSKFVPRVVSSKDVEEIFRKNGFAYRTKEEQR
ncbi:glycosyltransferase family 2 protein [Rummeliibacillus sp. NPDC094406]|uniref:glycosyltransferase family 2 protein n=1 Tax=Rummeliibacillus sp. NPDC094406 TaxID=3364511 RepID=UPI00382BAB27